MDINEIEVVLGSGVKGGGGNILNLVYAMGAKTKEQVFQVIMAKKIQRWYRRKLVENAEEETCFNIANVFKPQKSKDIRMIHKEYTDAMIMRYPTFAQNKVGIQVPFTGTKRSDVIRWMMKNMHGSQIAYVGI